MKYNELLRILALAGILLSGVNQSIQSCETTMADSSYSLLQNDTVKSNINFEDETIIKLFLNHVRLGNYEWSLKIWEEISYKETPELQSAYLKALEENGQIEGLYSKHRALLTKYPKNESSQFWIAKFYFEKAERNYQYELDKYKKDENVTTYAYLRRELRKISEDYRKSRDILEKLLAINPTQRNYMVYLRNCYIRLDMKEGVARMDKLLNR
jgi:tetratricopeptide (TPR) repeat protein